jgi:hypothetical protein
LPSQTRSPLEQDQEAESTRLMLDAIETRDQVTQRGLAGELGIALGLTNIYLKRCINKGLVKVRKAPCPALRLFPDHQGVQRKSAPDRQVPVALAELLPARTRGLLRGLRGLQAVRHGGILNGFGLGEAFHRTAVVWKFSASRRSVNTIC